MEGLAFALFRSHGLRPMRALLAILILTVAAPALAADPVALYVPFVRALSAMAPHYEPGLRESDHVEHRSGSDKEWPVERIPLPAPSRDLRPLLPLPGGRLVTANPDGA
jgi:hypothetical protein